MTGMPTSPLIAARLPAVPRAGLALALAAPLLVAQPAWSGSAYQLNIDNPQAYRMPDNPAYRLAPQFQRPQADAAPEAPAAASAAVPAIAPADLSGMPFARQIEAAARSSNLDPALVHAVIHVESRHRAQALSAKGAVGLMQVLPDTAARYGIANPQRSTEQNLRAGTRYLSDLMAMFDQRLDLVLAAYNSGERTVLRYANRIPPYPETRSYVEAVLAKYGEWGGTPQPNPRNAIPPAFQVALNSAAARGRR